MPARHRPTPVAEIGVVDRAVTPRYCPCLRSPRSPQADREFVPLRAVPHTTALTAPDTVVASQPTTDIRGIGSQEDLLRPGGWLVAHEQLPSPPPRSHPDLEALTGTWDLIYEVLHRNGVPARVVEDLPRSARQAGLEVTAMSGFFGVIDPEVMFELDAASIAALRERGIQLGIAAERIDGLVRDLQAAAKDGGYEWVTSAFFLDLALRKPAAG